IRLGNGTHTFTVASTHGTTAHIQSTDLQLGGGANQIYVESIAGPTSITTGSGHDVFVVGSDAAAIQPATNSTLNAIQKAGLTLIGGGGADELHAYDTADTAANTGVLTETDLTGLGMTLGIRYSGIEALDINLGKGADTFSVESTPLHSSLTLSTGDGTSVV